MGQQLYSYGPIWLEINIMKPPYFTFWFYKIFKNSDPTLD